MGLLLLSSHMEGGSCWATGPLGCSSSVSALLCTLLWRPVSQLHDDLEALLSYLVVFCDMQGHANVRDSASTRLPAC